MRARALALVAIAMATVAGLGTAVATTRPAPKVNHAAALMGVGNPHGVEAAPVSVPGADLEKWEKLYSRDMWPGMGVGDIHAH